MANNVDAEPCDRMLLGLGEGSVVQGAGLPLRYEMGIKGGALGSLQLLLAQSLSDETANPLLNRSVEGARRPGMPIRRVLVKSDSPNHSLLKHYRAKRGFL